MKISLTGLDTISRRAFVERCAATALGVSILPTGLTFAEESEKELEKTPAFGRAKNVIFITLGGGLSQIDSLDPKEGESKGPAKAIRTNADFQVTDYFPKLATVANKISVIRSMTAKVGVHKPAQYILRTGYEARGTILHPNLGAWGHHYLGKSSDSLPSNICINRRSDQGNGFFPSSYAPLAIGNPNSGISNVKPMGGKNKLAERVSLLNQLDNQFQKKVLDKKVQSYNGFYDDALSLMKSKDLRAFELERESEAVREEYGKSTLGQGCLLARRLVESGVRFIEVMHDGWDHHKNLADEMSDISPEFDTAFAALINDLEKRGLLNTTLVVVGTEFGRKPSFSGGGRSHHPLCFSTILAGGGTKQGYVHGVSDSKGYAPESDPVSIGDFHATVGYALGMEINKPAVSPSGRPLTVGDNGKPVMDIFSY